VLFDDPVDHGQSQPGAPAHFLGGKEWLEDPVAGFFIHAGAAVGDSEQREGAWLAKAMGRDEIPAQDRLLRRDAEGAAPGHGVPGVGGEVHQHLFQLVAVGKNGEGLVRKPGFAGDVFADHPNDEFLHPLDNFVQVHGFTLADLFPAEQEEILGEACGPVGAFQHVFDVQALGIIRGHAHEGQLAVTDDGHEDVVEVVGHPPGQGADGFHLHRMAHLFFQAAVFGEVQAGADESGEGAGGVIAGMALVEKPAVFAVVPAQPVFHGKGLRGLEGLGVDLQAMRQIIGMHPGGPAVAQLFF